MATYTDNYNLTKPTMNELADIRVINSNMDTVDEIMHGSQVSIADAYDPTLTYDVGDLVMNDFLLYKCVTAVTTPEAFDANKWTRVTAIGEIPTDTFTGATSQMAGDKGLVPAPSAGDQNKYLKANGTWDTPAGGGGGGGIDYSTTEQNTGLKWIDGSDIYQRTLVVDNLSVENSVRFTLPHGIVNIGKMISLECCMHTDETDFAGGVFLTPNASVYCTDTNISLSFPATWQASLDRVWYFTIKYTKTTSS